MCGLGCPRLHAQLDLLIIAKPKVSCIVIEAGNNVGMKKRKNHVGIGGNQMLRIIEGLEMKSNRLGQKKHQKTPWGGYNETLRRDQTNKNRQKQGAKHKISYVEIRSSKNITLDLFWQTEVQKRTGVSIVMRWGFQEKEIPFAAKKVKWVYQRIQSLPQSWKLS